MTDRPPLTFGPYVVHEELGTGGMATVHRAELAGIEGFSKLVALKRMLPSLAQNEEIVKAFVREARLASYLHHANCVTTYELGNIGGTYFIAMELLNGRSLWDIMLRCEQMRIAMPVPIALNILNQMLDALDYAHNLHDEMGQPLGIIHRDVSPTNVIIAEGGVAKLIDFGIAKASAVGMQTQSFSLKGKFAYMAPEYVALGKVDSRADIFAAGIIAYELLTARPLFSSSEDMETLHKLRSMDILPPSQVNGAVPTEIDHVILTALARDPAERWQQASAMRNALAVVTKRLGMELITSQVMQWVDDLFDDARAHQASQVPRMHTPLPVAQPEPPPRPVGRETGPATWLDDTNINAIIRSSSRNMTGAEPLWDMTPGAPTVPSVTATPAVGVALVVEKQRSRVLVIALVAIGVLAIAAVAGYFLM